MDRVAEWQHLTTAGTVAIPSNRHHPHPSSCTMFSVNGNDWIGEVSGVGKQAHAGHLEEV